MSDGTRVKTGGRKPGTPNRSTVDQKALQEYYVGLGYKSISEIAFLMANKTYADVDKMETEYGIESKEYDTAVKNCNAAVKTALPYFTTQIKALVLTDAEEFNEEAIANKAKEILAKFGK